MKQHDGLGEFSLPRTVEYRGLGAQQPRSKAVGTASGDILCVLVWNPAIRFRLLSSSCVSMVGPFSPVGRDWGLLARG